MGENQMQMPHRLTLNERRQLSMTGVSEVVSFDDTAVVLRTELGTLVIQGQQLQLKTLSLDEDTCFAISGAYTNEITVKDGQIAITASDCPGEDCVHSGSGGSVGRSIICLPNRVEIRVVAGQTDVDFVVG